MMNLEEPQEWWVNENGETTGPHSEAYLTTGLKTGAITPLTQATPVGSETWQPLNQWDTFAEACANAPQKPPASPGSYSDSPFTNPQLPLIANWICIYTILVSPFLWCVYLAESCAGGGGSPNEDSQIAGFFFVFSIVEFLVSTLITICLFIGGLRLRSLRRSGSTMLKITIWCSFAWFVLMLFSMLIAFISLGGENDFPEDTTAQTLMSFFVIVIGLCEFGFMIFTLIWLHRNANSLPLTEN